VPPAVTEIAALIYRLLFLLLDTITTVREAQAGRLGFRTWRTTYRSVAGQAGAVFVGSFDRARRLEQGLALRGYTGSLRVQVEARPVSRPFLAGMAALLTAVVALTLVLA
jgi:cobalt/nickel transport system permease protein